MQRDVPAAKAPGRGPVQRLRRQAARLPRYAAEGRAAHVRRDGPLGLQAGRPGGPGSPGLLVRGRRVPRLVRRAGVLWHPVGVLLRLRLSILLVGGSARLPTLTWLGSPAAWEEGGASHRPLSIPRGERWSDQRAPRNYQPRSAI